MLHRPVTIVTTVTTVIFLLNAQVSRGQLLLKSVKLKNENWDKAAAEAEAEAGVEAGIEAEARVEAGPEAEEGRRSSQASGTQVWNSHLAVGHDWSVLVQKVGFNL